MDNKPYKPPLKRPCPLTVATIEDPVVTPGAMARVIDRLDRLQASIDHLLDMCLQEEQEESSAIGD